MPLFKLGDFRSHSGLLLRYKIDCDALTDADLECVAFMLAERLSPFGRVEGIPRGGLRLAEHMKKYVSADKDVTTLLLVDDVLTTGNSMVAAKEAEWVKLGRPQLIRPYHWINGAVIFDRSGGSCPPWVMALCKV